MRDGTFSIRPATLDDAGLLAPLVAELGYPAEADEVSERLARVLRAADAGVLVAEREGELIAFAAYDVLELIYRPRPQCRITALVVRSDERRAGAGAALVEAIEQLAAERGCHRLELTTRPDREDALPFYLALGFTERPHRLVKALDGTRPA